MTVVNSRGWRLVDGVRGGSPPPIFLCERRRAENLFSAGFRAVRTAMPARGRPPGRPAGSAELGGPSTQAPGLDTYRLACWVTPP